MNQPPEAVLATFEDFQAICRKVHAEILSLTELTFEEWNNHGLWICHISRKGIRFSVGCSEDAYPTERVEEIIRQHMTFLRERNKWLGEP